MTRVRSILRLNKGGVVVGLEGAHPACAGPLVEVLLEGEAEVRVCFEAREILDAPEDARVVLLHAARDADFLNLARPAVSERRLRLFVWLRPGERQELSRRARDFLDWMQESVDVPWSVPVYAHKAIKRVLEEGGALYWEGPGLRNLVPAETVVLTPFMTDDEVAGAMLKGPVVVRRSLDEKRSARLKAIWCALGRKFAMIWDEPAVLPVDAERIIAEPFDWEVAADWLIDAGIDEPRIEAARLHLDPMAISRRALREPPPWLVGHDMVRSERGRPLGLRPEADAMSLGWWGDLFQICEPAGPPTDATLIVERPARWLLTELFGDPRWISQGPEVTTVTGGVGSGVSTELLSLGLQIHQRSCVVMFDVSEHLTRAVKDPAALQRLAPWELLALLGLAAVRVGIERWGIHWGSELQILDRSIWGSQSSGVRKALDAAYAMGGVRTPDAPMLDLGAWELPVGVGSRTAPDAHRSVEELNLVRDALGYVVDRLRSSTGLDVVFIVDGLGSQQLALLHELTEAAFELSFNMLLAVPNEFSALFGAYCLYDIPVIDVHRPTEYGAGIEFFLELLERRIRSIPGDGPSIPRSALERLAWASGGRPQDYLRLVRRLVEQAYAQSPDRLEDIADAVIRDHRSALVTGLPSEGYALLSFLLREVVDTVPEGDVARELYSLGLLRLYAGAQGEVRALPHPLLIPDLGGS